MTQVAPGAPGTFEAALEAIGHDAEAAMRSLSAALKEAKRVKSAAGLGQVRELQQALDGAVRLADEAAEGTRSMRDGWHFDVGEWFSSGNYTKELLAAAAEARISAFESDQQILCYPAIVRVSPADATVVVDKKKDRRVRPSVVVRYLAALQGRPPRFKADAFIESLATAYDLVVGAKAMRRGAPVKLIDVYRVLTLLPGTAREYSKQELARDLYLLDQSEIVHAKDGRRMSLPASALTRGPATLTTVTRGGQTKVYAGIAFTERSE